MYTTFDIFPGRTEAPREQLFFQIIYVHLGVKAVQHPMYSGTFCTIYTTESNIYLQITRCRTAPSLEARSRPLSDRLRFGICVIIPPPSLVVSRLSLTLSLRFAFFDTPCPACLALDCLRCCLGRIRVILQFHQREELLWAI
jgi:hypothetical protein